MSRARMLAWCAITSLIIMTSTLLVSTVVAAGFEPVVNMLGFASSTRVGDTIDWQVTFSNTGDTAGQNIVMSNTVGDGLQVDSVSISTGTTSINGRTVTISIPSLQPDETILFSIETSVISNGDLSNMSCVTAANLSGEECVRGLPVQALPNTGEAPFWRQPLLWLGVLVISTSSLLLGLGLLGLQSLQTPEEDY
ncbi:MAG: hypothetical protein AAFR81_26695 [Chloroflexota bacterium]